MCVDKDFYGLLIIIISPVVHKIVCFVHSLWSFIKYIIVITTPIFIDLGFFKGRSICAIR